MRNKDILDLNGESGDDSFVVRSFIALEIDCEGNEVDPDLGDLALAGGDDSDFVEVLGDFSTKEEDPDYVINSLVDIDGGTGDDRLLVVGTEKTTHMLFRMAESTEEALRLTLLQLKTWR